jgi:hypothetical protein
MDKIGFIIRMKLKMWLMNVLKMGLKQKKNILKKNLKCLRKNKIKFNLLLNFF